MKSQESSRYFDFYPLKISSIYILIYVDKFQVAPNKTLDRERQSVLRLDIGATDSPNGSGVSQQRTTIPLIIDVLDVNDNPPKFQYTTYMGNFELNYS